ncbi:MAG: LysM peptidoglycan-binding domain-containing C40 family peptidase [Lutibacter sp.]|nr:LysM peptidoglycan-binding domain-containing C40 family peptidase [Lutibacter sp.]MDP3945389.1 LysM peptidoglycan-binding domain-containing C40 family peptidase [Lutibacter sp.]
MNTYKLFTFLFLLTSSLIYSQTNIKHKITKGESIYAIAKKYDVKEAAIYELNPDIKGKLLKLNAVLLIPNNKFTADQIAVNTSKTDLSQAQNHIIASGETLSKISKKYGTSIIELERLNPAIPKKLPIGYSLIIREEPPTIEAITKEFGVNAIVENTPELATEEPATIQFLIETASKNLGTRYRSGGTTFSGFDCSGLMFNTFKEIDFTLPRSSNQQAKIGTKIQKSQAQKGDLIFFATNGSRSINHVGMITEIIGDEIKFIHSSVQLGVIVSSIKEAYYSKRFKQINRVLGLNTDKD